jgi:hypothetical protein
LLTTPKKNSWKNIGDKSLGTGIMKAEDKEVKGDFENKKAKRALIKQFSKTIAINFKSGVYIY